MKTILVKSSQTPLQLQAINGDANFINEQTLQKMHHGIAHFSFIKKDGSVREAFGTLSGDFIPPAADSQKERPEQPHLQKYLDIEAKGWRQYTIENLVALF